MEWVRRGKKENGTKKIKSSYYVGSVAPWCGVGGLTTDHSQGHSVNKYSEKEMYSCCFVSVSQCYWVGMPGTWQDETKVVPVEFLRVMMFFIKPAKVQSQP